jgi:Tfp pilus assembly major pilin PilA
MPNPQNNYKTLFTKVAKTKGYKTHNPSYGERKNNIDLILEGHVNNKTTKVTIDIKKKNGKNGNKWVWIEYDTSQGSRGWVYGDAQFIVFETSDAFIFVNRSKLLRWLQSSQMVRWDLPYVAKPWAAKYRLFRRLNTQETITQIQVSDLFNIEGTQRWLKS